MVTTQLPRTAKLGYQPSLDGLRAISVMAVIFFHAGFSWMQGGFLGVEVFFVVSGFLITTLLMEERAHSGAVDFRQFWLRRGRRLLPALYLLLAVVSVASLIVYRDAAGRMGGDVLAALFYVYNWWLIFLDQPYFEQAGRPPLLQHLWSLAVEEQFYLVFPPLFVVGLVKLGHVKVRWALLGTGLASAVLMAVLYNGGKGKDFVYFSTITRLSGLLLGCFLAMVWTPWKSRATAARSAGPVLDIIGGVSLLAIVVMMMRVNGFDSFVYHGGFVMLDVITLVLIAVLVHPAARLSGLLSVPALVWIGVRSYSLYLWHWPIFQVTRPGLDVPFTGFPLFVFRMVLTFAAAEASFRFIETPLRKGAFGHWWDGIRSTNPARRAFFVRRGITVGATFVVLVLMIGWGLQRAASDPMRAETEAAMLAEATGGVVDAGAGDDPSKPVIDPDETTTTVDASTTSTSSIPPVSTAPGVTPTDAVAVGDSVMLGAKPQIEAAMPGIRVDGKVARQFDSLTAVAQWYIQEGYVPGTLIVHAGTNGTFEDEDLDKLIEAAGDRKVLLVNAKVERGWRDLVNGRMAAAADRYDNVELVDWYGFSNGNPEWFTGDGSHLKPEGARQFAELIRTHL